MLTPFCFTDFGGVGDRYNRQIALTSDQSSNECDHSPIEPKLASDSSLQR